MRVNSIGYIPYATSVLGVKKKSDTQKSFNQMRVISLSEYRNQGISFTGSKPLDPNRNKDQMVFIGAESDPWAKGGGVGTVMKDYRSFTTSDKEIEIIPYYGADTDTVNGTVKPRKNPKGEYVINKKGDDVPVELIAKRNMQWGKDAHNEIMLFRENTTGKKTTYFVFVDSVAQMKKPYEGSYDYKSGAKHETNYWNGDPYAKFSKACVELLPDAIKDKGNGFNPATVICSDAQTAYVIEYMAKKAVEDKGEDINEYEGIKPTYVAHNLGPGYCGETSKQNMFVNLGATPQQIAMIESDPIYQQNILGDDYFKPFVKETLDDTGTASAIMIPVHYTSSATGGGKGYSKAFTTVAEEYAKNIVENPQTAHNLHKTLGALYAEGRFTGILNPLEDESVKASKPLPNVLYNKECSDKTNVTYKPLKAYPVNVTYEKMREIKNYNKLALLERLSSPDETIISGDPKRKAKVNPYQPEDYKYKSTIVRPELLSMIEEGKGSDVPLIVSWGRADTQKGHDITLDAFEQFAKSKEGKNAILILGAGLNDDEESNKIRAKIEEMYKDPELEGRIIHIDGWAPAYAMASAADAAIFASRFEPCGLTDLEAMKYYCTPIVTNTQGFKQKNYDPRIEGEKEHPTSYKTTHEYNLLKSQVELIIKGYGDGDEVAKEKAKEEFPVFYKEVDGKKTYDDSSFAEFAASYKRFIADKNEAIRTKMVPEKDYPKGWDDWDKLSRDYNFKYKGFARKLKDDILAAEIAEALKAQHTADDSVKEKIFKNLDSLQTGWKNNQSSHPSGKSTHEMYQELHLAPEYTKPERKDIIAKNNADIRKQIEDRQRDDMKSRVATYAAGGLTGLGAMLFAKTGHHEYKNQEQELRKQIDILNGKIRHLNAKYRKLLFLTGALSAAAAATITFIASRNHYKEKLNGKEALVITGNGEVVKATPKSSPKPEINSVAPMSFSDFQAGIAKK